MPSICPNRSMQKCIIQASIKGRKIRYHIHCGQISPLFTLMKLGVHVNTLSQTRPSMFKHHGAQLAPDGFRDQLTRAYQLLLLAHLRGQAAYVPSASDKSLQTERKRVPIVLRRNVEQMRGAGVQDALTVAPGNAAAISETASAASRDWHPCNNDREHAWLKTRSHERKRHA
jgi:hypothetical protein